MPTFKDINDLTSDDKSKTIAEFLGMGSDMENVLAQLEQNSAPLKEFLRKYDYDLAYDSRYKDGKGNYFPYTLRAFLFQDKKDEKDRLIADLTKLTPRTVGEFLSQKDVIKRTLIEQASQIKDDYEYNYGTKRDAFLTATEFNSSTDGDMENYFYRFWRSPISKLMDYRGIDVGNSEGEEHAKKILRKLYGPETDGTDITILLNETPECLVEDKNEIDREKSRKRAFKNELEESLKNEPVWKTFSEIHGVIFPNPSDHYEMADIAFRNEDTKEYMRKLLGLEKRDTPDLALFTDTILLSPNEIVQRKDELKEALIQRIDERYVSEHPDYTFGTFLRERRDDLLSEDAKRAALGIVINKPAASVDNTAVKHAQDIPISELKAQADKIVAESAKRRKRRPLIIAGISALTALTLFFAGKAVFSGSSKEDKPVKAPTAERPKSPAPKKQVAPTPAQPVVQTNQTQKAVTPAGTNLVQKALDRQNATNTANVVQQPQKPTQIIGKKGNHLIGLRWDGYKDIDYSLKLKNVADLVFQTHFDYMNREIQERGLPFG
ncbi:MAG: hypothetical protein MJ210_05825, partial [Alphaproteobacteria bacterium]|nr:hypothetical protein [Alphaproteobacteria bacterium]